MVTRRPLACQEVPQISSAELTGDEAQEAVKLLTDMRLAAGVASYSDAERVGPKTRQWVSALEQEGDGDLSPVIYLLRLAKRSAAARDVLAAALGTAFPATDDAELRLLVAQIAGAWDDPRKRKALRKGVEALFEAWGEEPAERGTDAAASS